ATKRLHSGKTTPMHINSGILVSSGRNLPDFPLFLRFGSSDPKSPMRNPSLSAYASYETKILPTSQPSYQTLWQMALITNRQSHRNFWIVITTNIFGSAWEHGRNKGCRLLQTFAPNTACYQSGVATLAWCKKLPRNRSTRSAIHVAN